MLKVENRESAHLRSRVKDLSVVPNVVSYTGLFACITPVAKLKEKDGLFEPILIRDTDSLIANFGDPRIDPEKYIDLYSIMNVIGNGTSCYVAKVKSGESGVYSIDFNKTTDEIEVTNTESFTVIADTDNKQYTSENTFTAVPAGAVIKVGTTTVSSGVSSAIVDSHIKLTFTEAPEGAVTIEYTTTSTQPHVFPSGENPFKMIAYSSMAEPITITCTLSQAKPYSLKAIYINVAVSLGSNALASAKVKLEDSTTNQGLVNAINSSIGTYARLELDCVDFAGAAKANDNAANSIVKSIYDHYLTSGEVPEVEQRRVRDLTSEVVSTTSAPSFEVTLDSYVKALEQYKDKKYVGCMMADLTAPVSKTKNSSGEDAYFDNGTHTTVKPLSHEERRALHYNLKQIACERKDCTVVMSTPYCKDYLTDTTMLTMDNACEWVTSQGSFADLWEYGESNTTDYSLQSFYLEIYHGWLNMQCTKIEGGLAKSVSVKVPPSNVVINNILTSYRERGVQYPVAGDHYGTLPETCTVIDNPKTKLIRDQLVQCRINPIYDTGTRGIQIFGNETLNAGYTDLNAAHIARTLVNLRSRIDEYTETLKFLINSQVLWDTWKNYVSLYILEPLKSGNALSSYRVAMGTDTTTPEEIANRTIKGTVEVTFYQSAEIFDLTFTVYSSATTVE